LQKYFLFAFNVTIYFFEFKIFFSFFISLIVCYDLFVVRIIYLDFLVVRIIYRKSLLSRITYYEIFLLLLYNCFDRFIFSLNLIKSLNKLIY